MTSPFFHEDTSLVLRRVFSAPRLQVFRAWIRSEALEAWMRPGGKSLTVRELDTQVGGSFCFDLEDGTSITGSYLDITPPEKLVFTWIGRVTCGRETIVTVDFFERGLKTEVVLTHEQLDSLPVPSTFFGEGWRVMFSEFEKFLLLSA